MNIHRFLASILLGTVLWFGGYQPASAQALCVATVDGSEPVIEFDTIQLALDTGHIFISFTGTCPGFNISGINNVTLTGDGTGAGATSEIDGRIDIFGATNILLQNFTIKPVIANPLRVGILVFRGSYLGGVSNVVIEGQLSILHNSGAELRDTTITAPVDLIAVRVFRNSFLGLGPGNSIEGTGSGRAVTVASNSSFISFADGNQISGVPTALSVSRGSVAEIRQGAIDGNVNGDLDSVVSIGNPFLGGNASLSGIVTISRDSALVFEVPTPAGTVTFTGSVTCLDDESSVSGSPSGTGVATCTSFDQVAGGGDDDDD